MSNFRGGFRAPNRPKFDIGTCGPGPVSKFREFRAPSRPKFDDGPGCRPGPMSKFRGVQGPKPANI